MKITETKLREIIREIIEDNPLSKYSRYIVQQWKKRYKHEVPWQGGWEVRKTSIKTQFSPELFYKRFNGTPFKKN